MSVLTRRTVPVIKLTPITGMLKQKFLFNYKNLLQPQNIEVRITIDTLPLTSIQCRVQENVDLYSHFPYAFMA
jgi:hypothetical protein